MRQFYPKAGRGFKPFEAFSTPDENVAGRNPAVFLMDVCAIVVSGLD
jgi:hypothetical protein